MSSSREFLSAKGCGGQNDMLTTAPNGREEMINSADKVAMASCAYGDTTGGTAAINDIVLVDSKQRRANIVTSSRMADHNFPAKLHYVLTELEREGKAHIAGFMPHGRAFKVFKHQEFVDEVLNW
jgi:hypothetical protein